MRADALSTAFEIFIRTRERERESALRKKFTSSIKISKEEDLLFVSNRGLYSG